jgi:hypothetical protein
LWRPGCTASHRALLEIIAYHEWPRVLILEDDFEICVPDFSEQFAAAIGEVPDDWDMIYLGGGYGEPPQYRHSEHVIRVNRTMTTSSYAVTDRMARRLALHVYGNGPIDSIYGGFHRDARCYIVQPRLMVQYANVSDLTLRHMDNAPSMLDPHHEDMISGEWTGPLSNEGTRRLRSQLVRRELADRHDLDGRPVIVGRDLFTVVAVESRPDHPRPWRRGEPCTYLLAPADRER